MQEYSATHFLWPHNSEGAAGPGAHGSAREWRTPQAQAQAHRSDPALRRRGVAARVLLKRRDDGAVLLPVHPEVLAVRRVVPAVVVHRGAMRRLLLHEEIDMGGGDERIGPGVEVELGARRHVPLPRLPNLRRRGVGGGGRRCGGAGSPSGSIMGRLHPAACLSSGGGRRACPLTSPKRWVIRGSAR